MLHCGLLGETLGHSYSPMIHHALADYDYRLFEVPKPELDAFLKTGAWDGLNVTIPYKKAVVPYCDALSEAAARLQSVNTLVRQADGPLYGDNTDLFGFLYMVRRSGIDPAGTKALVLGSGGASVTVKVALEQLGASVTVISRSGPDNYDNLDRHADAQIIANTTPLGMYPRNGTAAVDLTRFPRCEGVLDIVYNPGLTALLLQAEQLGIPHAGGRSPAFPLTILRWSGWSIWSADICGISSSSECPAAASPPWRRLLAQSWAGRCWRPTISSRKGPECPFRTSLPGTARPVSGSWRPRCWRTAASAPASSSPPAAAVSRGRKTILCSTRTAPFSV